MSNFRTNEDTAYYVYWESPAGYHMDKIIANDHEDALKQVEAKEDHFQTYLVMKGEPLILWQA